MSPWDFPPEYGCEEGDRCGRGYRGCHGRMVIEEIEEECTAGCEPLCDCPITTATVCNVCGEGDW